MTTKFSFIVLLNAFCFWQYAIAAGPAPPTPTLVPATPFDAKKDSDEIWDAVDGWGTDEDDINEVLCKRTYKQRTEIAAIFEKDHNTVLLTKLEKETSGDLKKLYRRLLGSHQTIMAIDLYETIDGKRKDYGAVTEICCGSDVQDKDLIAAYYRQNYNMNVLDHVKKYKSGDTFYQSVLCEYCWRTYCTTSTLTPAKALEIAKKLFSIDTKADSATFRATLQTYFKTYCVPDIKAIFVNYRTVANRGIDDAIREALKGDEASAWVALALSMENRPKYFASLLQEAVKGGGTDEDRVMRIVLETCEKDLGDINEEYKVLYGETAEHRLHKFWGGDTSRYVKDCMKKLFGK